MLDDYTIPCYTRQQKTTRWRMIYAGYHKHKVLCQVGDDILLKKRGMLMSSSTYHMGGYFRSFNRYKKVYIREQQQLFLGCYCSCKFITTTAKYPIFGYYPKNSKSGYIKTKKSFFVVHPCVCVTLSKL